MLRKLAIIGAILAGGLGLAMPAMAQTTPVNNSVSGTVIIPATLTMSLSGNNFTLNPNPGDTINTGTGPFAITATVNTNDGSGYTLSESLTTAFNDGSNHTLTTNPYIYSGGPGSSASFGPTLGATPETIASSNQPANNDQYGLAWQFPIPGNQAAGSYTGTIMVTAVGN